MTAPAGFGALPQRLLGMLRALPGAEIALWAPAALVVTLTLADYAVVLRAEADLRIAATRAAVALGSGRIDPPQAAAMVRRELDDRVAQGLSVSVSMSDRAAVELRLPTKAATLFGFHWFLPEDPIRVRGEAMRQRGADGAELAGRS